jgi:putative phage-type endonuclease
MIKVNPVQGSPEWHAHRANHFNASDAPAMMGLSNYKTRAALLHEKHTGLAEEVNSFTQQLFDAGHAAEAATRPAAEEIIGEELYPVVATDDDGYLSASFDGITMLGTPIWENKLHHEGLATYITANMDLPGSHWPQVEHQLIVSGADTCIFTTATKDGEITATLNYKSKPARKSAVLAGWKQFEADLAAYKPPTPEVAKEGKAPDQLPALRIELTGLVTASNLQEFRDQAIAVFKGINKDLQTDEDFADADKTVKWCGDIEDRLKAAKQHALSQTQSIDELFRAVDDISAEARRVRLDLEKLIKARKEARKDEIIREAKAALSAHIATINASIKPLMMPDVAADFAGAIKGLKTFSSMSDKASGELARAKIEASRIADLIRVNQATMRELAAGHAFLFSDAQQIILKQNDDLKNLIKSRIADHDAQVKAKEEALRELIRKEEAAKAAVTEAMVSAAKCKTGIIESTGEEVTYRVYSEAAEITAEALSDLTKYPVKEEAIYTGRDAIDDWEESVSRVSVPHDVFVSMVYLIETQPRIIPDHVFAFIANWRKENGNG